MERSEGSPGDYQLGVLHGQVLARLDALDQRWDEHLETTREDSRLVHERLDKIERGVNGRRGLSKYRAEAVAGTGVAGVVALILFELLGKLL